MGDPFTTDPRAEELRSLILAADALLDKMYELLDSIPTVTTERGIIDVDATRKEM